MKFKRIRFVTNQPPSALYCPKDVSQKIKENKEKKRKEKKRQSGEGRKKKKEKESRLSGQSDTPCRSSEPVVI